MSWVNLYNHYCIIVMIICKNTTFFYENTKDCNVVTISQNQIVEVNCTVYLITKRLHELKKKSCKGSHWKYISIWCGWRNVATWKYFFFLQNQEVISWKLACTHLNVFFMWIKIW